MPICAGRQIGRIALVLQRAQEGEGAGDVVIGHHQRHVEPLVDIVIDLAAVLHDLLVGPAFDRAAEIDADELAEHPGIDAFADNRAEGSRASRYAFA